MSDDLRSQLLGAGLVDAQAADKVQAARDAEASRRERARAGRAPSKGGGRRGGEPRRPPVATWQALAEALARLDSAEAAAEPLDPAEASRLADVAQAGRVAGGGRGHRRFYVLGRGGRLRFVEASQKLMQGLERGDVAVVERPDGELLCVGREAASSLGAEAPAWIRFWSAREAEAC